MKPMISPAKPAGRLARDRRTEDGEDEDRGADDLGREADREAGVGVDRDGAQAELGGVVAGQDDQGEPAPTKAPINWATM